MAVKILAADIGGTNSRFALFESDDGSSMRILKTVWMSTNNSPNFGHLIQSLRESDFTFRPEEADIVSLAVAGPVEGGVYCKPPFISWDINITSAKQDYGFSNCFLINDFVAQAYACRSPIGKDAAQILAGVSVPGAATAVIGAGTGLGKAILIELKSGGCLVLPSEGGHATFPFLAEEHDYQRFLVKELKEDRITGNQVLSGSGIRLLHRYLTGEDLAPQEITRGFTDDSPTLAWASRFYGRACRNLALEVLALGGVYIAGGVAAKTPLFVSHRSFEQEFRSSRSMEKVLSKIPVFLVTNEDSGLWGAAFFGLQSLKDIGSAENRG